MMSAPVKSEVPFWLNKSLFRDVVKSEYTNPRIVGFSAKPASGKGENYASVLYRINIRVENETNGLAQRSFMVKVNHETGFGIEMAKMMQLFPKEIKMYKELLPTFEGYFAATGEQLKLAPKCVFAATDPREIIIMEDISVDGYKTADRSLGLDMDHVTLVIDKLAKYHAASAYHIEQVGPYDDLFKYGIVNEQFNSNRDMSGHYAMLKGFLKDLKCTPLLNKMFDNYDQLIHQNTVAAVKPRSNHFNVLCHGDMWSNNIMFRYNEDTGRVEETLMVDFQMCFYGSAMLDLHYLIVNSLNKANKVSKMDTILHMYHKKLVKNLRLLNYTGHIPTLMELQMDFLDTGFYGLFSAISILPVITAPSSDDSTLDNLTSDAADTVGIKKRMYTNSIFTAYLEELIPYYEMKGYLEL